MISEEFGSSKRRTILVWLFAAGFLLLVGRLYQLQYIYREEYGKKSEENSIRKVPKEPIRGYIYDKNGILIVDNRPSYSVMMTPVDFDIKKLPLLSEILQVPIALIIERYNKAKTYSAFIPARIKRDVDFRTLSLLEEYKNAIPGIEVQIESKRFYSTPARASHLLGYAKEISDWQLTRLGSYYRQGDVVGASGIEAKYEESLRGDKGFDFISQNAKGQVIGTFDNGRSDIPPKDGLDLHLAVDIKVQALAESLMANRRGAVVAIDPEDGGIIAMVSKPDYDLGLFSGVTSPEIWKSLNDNEERPLFNRATLTRYPPGSTFKMVLAAAALENGVIDERWRINCYGFFRYGNKIFKDLHVHGSVNVVQAIQMSCNVFFYQLMLKVGLDPWSGYAKEFGFGRTAKIDILEENPGILPSSEYYNRVYGAGKWTTGYSISLGIGQGEVGVTPLQMANYTGMLANKGKLFQPHIVRTIHNKWTHNIDTVKADKRQLYLSEKTWDLVREGMRRVVEEPGGTGMAARVTKVVSAGKTGTAQNPHGNDHAWYIGFAPFDNPKIAICVLVENGGFGGALAAPIAGLCIEQYLFGELIRYKPAQPKTTAAKEKPVLGGKRSAMVQTR